MKDSAEILSSERSTPARPRDTTSSSSFGAPPQAEGTETAIPANEKVIELLEYALKPFGESGLTFVWERVMHPANVTALLKECLAALRGTEAAIPAETLTFSRFSAANRERCESPDGFNHKLGSWSTSDWFVAIVGELGEAANITKKLNRVRDGVKGNKETPAELRDKQRRELGDAFVYLDLIAQSLGFNIGGAAVEVFNAKSEEIGCPIRLNVRGTEAATPAPLETAEQYSPRSNRLSLADEISRWNDQGDIEVAMKNHQQREWFNGHGEALHWCAKRVRDAMLSGDPVTAKEEHLLDLYDSLGVKWGDDPFSRIAELKGHK